MPCTTPVHEHPRRQTASAAHSAMRSARFGRRAPRQGVCRGAYFHLDEARNTNAAEGKLDGVRTSSDSLGPHTLRQMPLRSEPVRVP